MVVTPTEDTSLSGGSAKATCTGCTGSCLKKDTLCNSKTLVVSRHSRDTLVVQIHPGGNHGWLIEIEVDAGQVPPKARIFRLPFTDALSCTPGLPLSADTGSTVKLSSLQDAKDVHGEFSADFADGLHVSGSF